MAVDVGDLRCFSVQVEGEVAVAQEFEGGKAGDKAHPRRRQDVYEHPAP